MIIRINIKLFIVKLFMNLSESYKNRIAKLAGINALNEANQLNFYDFKKAVKNNLAKLKMFMDSAVIDSNGKVIIDFHASDATKNVRTNQFYCILNSLYNNFHVNSEIFNLMKNKDIFRTLQLVDNGQKPHLFEKPTFEYISPEGLGSLEAVLKDFFEKAEILTLHPSFIDKIPLYMKEKFMEEQKRLLKPLIKDKFESIDTILMLSDNNKYFVDVKYKDIKLDEVKLMIVGKISIEFMQDGKPTEFSFTNLQELKGIFDTVFDLIKVEPLF